MLLGAVKETAAATAPRLYAEESGVAGCDVWSGSSKKRPLSGHEEEQSLQVLRRAWASLHATARMRAVSTADAVVMRGQARAPFWPRRATHVCARCVTAVFSTLFPESLPAAREHGVLS